MCETVGLPLVKLKRVRYGNILLGELKPGEFRQLAPSEVKMLARDTPPLALEKANQGDRDKKTAADKQKKSLRQPPHRVRK
jgi:hypothetical protein